MENSSRVLLRHIDLIKSGDANALFSLFEKDECSAAETYLALLAARDFAVEPIDARLEDICETGLRTDDEGREQALAHWQLAVTYLAVDEYFDNVYKAEEHFEEAMKIYHNPDLFKSLTRELLEVLPQDQKSILQTVMSRDAMKELTLRVERIQRLREVNAPKYIQDSEKDASRIAVAKFLEL